MYRETINNEDDIIIENGQVKLIIRKDGISKSLLFKPTHEECLTLGENIPIFSITQERPYHNEIKLSHPSREMVFQANLVSRKGDKLIVGFELIPDKAVIRINETLDYISFRFEDFIVETGDYPKYLKINAIT